MSDIVKDDVYQIPVDDQEAHVYSEMNIRQNNQVSKNTLILPQIKEKLRKCYPVVAMFVFSTLITLIALSAVYFSFTKGHFISYCLDNLISNSKSTKMLK